MWLNMSIFMISIGESKFISVIAFLPYLHVPEQLLYLRLPYNQAARERPNQPFIDVQGNLYRMHSSMSLLRTFLWVAGGTIHKYLLIKLICD
jgi:hypothetical protein